MDALHTLEILISSRTPLIAIETLEEERAEQARGVELMTDHVLEELRATKPLSVIRAEEVEALREWARGRTVPAS
jgi:hypothetical protein